MEKSSLLHHSYPFIFYTDQTSFNAISLINETVSQTDRYAGTHVQLLITQAVLCSHCSKTNLATKTKQQTKCVRHITSKSRCQECVCYINECVCLCVRVSVRACTIGINSPLSSSSPIFLSSQSVVVALWPFASVPEGN